MTKRGRRLYRMRGLLVEPEYRYLQDLPIEFTYMDPRGEPVHWFTNILVDDPQALGDYLKGRGIGTRRFFYPITPYTSNPVTTLMVTSPIQKGPMPEVQPC